MKTQHGVIGKFAWRGPNYLGLQFVPPLIAWTFSEPWPKYTVYAKGLQCICLSLWASSSEFVSSSIPSWQILTAHAQPFRGSRDLAFCLKVPLHSLLIWASSEGSGETARMRRFAWTFAARIGDKYQIRLTRSIWCMRFLPNHKNSYYKRKKKKKKKKQCRQNGWYCTELSFQSI